MVFPVGAVVTGLTSLLSLLDKSNNAAPQPKSPHINLQKLDWKNKEHMQNPIFPQFRDAETIGTKPWQPNPSVPTNFPAQQDFYSHYGQGPEWDYFLGKKNAKAQQQGIGNLYPVGQPTPPAFTDAYNRTVNQQFAKGGHVKSSKEDAAVVQMTIAAMLGKAPNAQVIVAEFVKRFGRQALDDLMARVQKAASPSQAPAPEPDQPPGQAIQGQGDGLSDSIPAQINGQEPASLSDGEFVVPADVVSGIGNGSTNAGVKQLHGLIDHVRQQRTGTKKSPPPLQ